MIWHYSHILILWNIFIFFPFHYGLSISTKAAPDTILLFQMTFMKHTSEAQIYTSIKFKAIKFTR